MTKAALMGTANRMDSGGGGKPRENDVTIMPPPPSPAWRRMATPKRDSSVPRSPHSDLFPDENLTECRAVPNHLFSPNRQAELAGSKTPRYQEIPLDYQRPKSVNSANLDTWLNSPGGPATPGGPSPPGGPSTHGGPSTPGGPATPVGPSN